MTKKSTDPIALAVEFNPDALIIRAGDQTYTLARELFLSLLTPGWAGDRFRCASKTDDNFAEFTADDYVKVARLVKHELGIPDIARLLGVDRTRLANFWQHALKTHAGPATKPLLDAALAGDYLPARPSAEYLRAQSQGYQQKPWDGKTFVVGKLVAAYLRKGLDVDDIAFKLGVTRPAMAEWIAKNRDWLDKL